jgi:hypothetical protein
MIVAVFEAKKEIPVNTTDNPRRAARGVCICQYLTPEAMTELAANLKGGGVSGEGAISWASLTF